MPASCIIPFYNESQRLGAIVDVALSCDLVGEVILVDDGSNDGGYSRESPRLSIHRFSDNQGKAEAMRFGFNQARFETILFLDADLKGLTRDHLHQLLEPVLSNDSDLTISMREQISFFDVVSGERALEKNKWKEFFTESACQRNAMEIAMNHYALSKQLKVRWIPWPEVSQTYKSQKIPWLRGLYKDVRNVIDWVFQLGIFRFGCTYLMSWLIIVDRRSRLTEWYRSVYLKMYKDIKRSHGG